MSPERYSIFRHLARALWPNLRDSEAVFMVYGITCYYDASSKEEVLDKPLVLAGIAATEAKWTQFEEKWATILAGLGKGIEYFDSAACSEWQGDFKTWNRDAAARAALLERLASTIRETGICISIAWMRPRDFHAVNREFVLDARDDVLSPYRTLADVGSDQFNDRLSSSPCLEPGHRIAHIFEHGDSGQGPMRNLIARGKLPTMAVQVKWNKTTGDKVHAFAACDLVAYYYGRALKRQHAGRDGGIPAELQEHFRHIKTYAGQISARVLRETCEADPCSFPRRLPQP